MIRVLALGLLLATFPDPGRCNALHPGPEPCRILVNQVGYLPHLPKLALLTGDPVGAGESLASVVSAATGATAFEVSPGTPYREEPNGPALRVLDFSGLKKTGRYRITWQGERSAEFAIGPDIFTEALTLLMRSYTLQRCGVALNDPLTGLRHGPCHTRDGVVAHEDAFAATGTPVEARGGWHDAGDFGKYVATTAVTVGRLLACRDETPTLFEGLDLSFPETDKGPVCDTLTEIRVGLDWMLRMQRRDGAFYRKLSGASWPGAVPPDADLQIRYLYGISTPETAKAAAALAMAARIYKKGDPAFAHRCLKAARLGWQFLMDTPGMRVDVHKGDDTGSGPYLAGPIDTEATLTTDLDDRFWAAAELFITTGEAPFLAEVERILPLLPWGLFEWKDPSSLGMANLLRHSNTPGRITEALNDKLFRRADTLVANVRKSPWMTANTRMVWGSNKMTAEEGITLALAAAHTANPSYLSAATAQLNYLLGVNPFGLSYVTGLGETSVNRVNHLFGRAVGINIPGLLVGGPNANAEDGIAPKDKGVRSYIDSEKSYATNEYAIDYNAAIIGLMVHLTALEKTL
ncbi:glycoside hydrolase family 9 protein [Desulfoluna spongiiphila]|uniref:glycoside hydrolase family 9 protein n=1 Tax=Desulfoluna spongiiphila TaxID=419481 RepID=UPI00125AA90C|nr:glycoside hydrolase family 9 protein [Desulfoluna spongiiphila]VVS92139.1 immunoglobulin e-set [Desulfoluna spongiiphila]